MMDLNPLRLPCRKSSISSVLVLQWRGYIKLSTSAFRLKQKVWLIFCYSDLSFFLKSLWNYLRTLFALYHIKHKDSITCGYLVRCPCWDLAQNRKPKETISNLVKTEKLKKMWTCVLKWISGRNIFNLIWFLISMCLVFIIIIIIINFDNVVRNQTGLKSFWLKIHLRYNRWYNIIMLLRKKCCQVLVLFYHGSNLSR